VNSLKERKKKTLPLFDLDSFWPQNSDAPGVEEQLDSADLKKMLNRSLDQLASKYREPIILYYQEGLSYKEISDVLGLPVSTVGVRVKRAKEALRALHQKHDFTPSFILPLGKGEDEGGGFYG